MRSSMLLVSMGFAGTPFGVLPATTPARANICDDLWVQRNSIYKAYGYCFKTPKAISEMPLPIRNEGDIPSTSTHFRDQTRLSKARGPNVAPRRFANSQETAIP